MDVNTLEKVPAEKLAMNDIAQVTFKLAQPLFVDPYAAGDARLTLDRVRFMADANGATRFATSLRLDGPLPADTAFLPAKLRGFDAVLAMYHDQGLPVLKYSDFANAVNISLGLPYPRVAVDHGTALELAGKGSADPSSLYAAIRTCARFARNRMPA